MVVPPRQSRPPFWRIEPAENNLFFSLYHLSEGNLARYWEAIHRWHPEEIVCYPSGATVMADWMIRHGHALTGVRAVFTMSETLFDWQREKMEQAFGTRVANLYGLAENVAWIAECRERRLHVRPDYGYTEFIPIEGAESPAEHPASTVCEIVSTGFLNMAMPLLRYRTGDQVLLTPADDVPCTCGLRNFPTVTRIIGRVDENLVTSDGRIHTRLDGVLKGIPGVQESQIEQIALDRLLVRIVAKENYGPATTEELTRRLQRLFGSDCTIGFETVAELPRTKAGKVRYQVNSLPAEVRGRLARSGDKDGDLGNMPRAAER
jgi:phenylacetate-CoA ligase